MRLPIYALMSTLVLLPSRSALHAQELSGPVTDVSKHDAAVPIKSLVIAEADDASGGMKIPVQLELTLGGYWDDNIYTQPRGPNRVSDFVWSVIPVISYNSARATGLENSVQVSYSPGFVFYQRHEQNNTVDQTGNFVYGYHGAKTDLMLSQQYASVQDNGPDVGNLVKLQEYLTTLNLDYALTAKLGLTLRAQQDITNYDRGLDSTEWTGSAYLNYEALPKTTLSLGSLFGSADLEGPNQTFEQINGRVLYFPTAKLSFNATGGAEFRQTQNHGGSQLEPTFSLGFDYDPADGMDLILNAYRNFSYSAKFYGNDYLTTGVSGSVSQRFLDKFYLTVTGSFENATYENNFTIETDRLSYDYFSVQPLLNYRPNDWCSLNLFYEFRQNITNTVTPFTDNQVGFQSRFVY